MVNKIYVQFFFSIFVILSLQCAVNGNCSSEAVSVITKEAFDLFDKILTNIKVAVLESVDNAKQQLSKDIKKLNKQEFIFKAQENCYKKLYASIDTENLEIQQQLSDCNTDFEDNIIYFENNFELEQKKFKTAQEKLSDKLQTCAKEHGEYCLHVANCCQLVLTKIIQKLDLKANSSLHAIEEIVSDQNNCLKTVHKEKLKIRKRIDIEVLKCTLEKYISAYSKEALNSKVQDDSEDSSTSKETGKSNSLNESEESHARNNSTELGNSFEVETSSTTSNLPLCNNSKKRVKCLKLGKNGSRKTAKTIYRSRSRFLNKSDDKMSTNRSNMHFEANFEKPIKKETHTLTSFTEKAEFKKPLITEDKKQAVTIKLE